MINLTPNATEQLKKILSQTDKKLFLSLTKTGCSGFSYKLDMLEEQKDNVLDVHVNGISLMVDKNYLDYLQDLTIDYKKEGFNTSFHFINPIEKDRCGCGLSFRIK